MSYIPPLRKVVVLQFILFRQLQFGECELQSNTVADRDLLVDDLTRTHEFAVYGTTGQGNIRRILENSARSRWEARDPGADRAPDPMRGAFNYAT